MSEYLDTVAYRAGWEDGRAALTDTDALAILAKHGRVIAIVVPRGVDTEDIQQVTREVNDRLDALVAQRGPMS